MDIRKTIRIVLLSAAFIVSLLVNSQAAEIKDVYFKDQVVIHDVELNLTGVAVLKWAMLFNVYAGAFYLPDKASGSQWTENVSKKLELSYFREIKAKGFAEASDKLLRDNLEEPAYEALSDRLQTFYAFFKNVRPGDRYSINYTPELGTELRLNGQAIGRVPGHDFAIAYFGIWLGDNPINRTFRDKLLGAR